MSNKSSIFDKFIRTYKGRKHSEKDEGWYFYEKNGRSIKLSLSDDEYILKTILKSATDGTICFRIEDFKEYFFKSKNTGPSDNDLTILNKNEVYQLEIKDGGDTNKVNSQFKFGDSWLNFIDWFSEHDTKYCESVNTNYIFLSIQHEKDSLLRGNMKAKAKISSPTRCSKYIRIILWVPQFLKYTKGSGKGKTRPIINFDIDEVIKKCIMCP